MGKKAGSSSLVGKGLFDVCQVKKVCSIKEAFPEVALLFLVDVVIFVVPLASSIGGVIWGCDILKHLLPCVVHFFCMLCSSCPASREVRLVIFLFVEEIFDGPHACMAHMHAFE